MHGGGFVPLAALLLLYHGIAKLPAYRVQLAWALSLALLLLRGTLPPAYWKALLPHSLPTGMYDWWQPLNFVALRGISYVVDCARGDASPALLSFGAYVMYAPLWIAGPILPYASFVEQTARGRAPFGKVRCAFYHHRCPEAAISDLVPPRP